MKLKIFDIAVRNVFKHKRRSFLNMMTFAVNVLVILYGIGMLNGQFNNMYQRMINLSIGHFKIYNKDYLDEKRTRPLDINIQAPEKVIDAIRVVPHFVEASPRIIHPGILSNSRKKIGVMINGIDIKREKKILTAYDKVDGQLISEDKDGILIGKKLAQVLKVSKNDELLLYSQTLHNANNLVDSGVTVIYSVGFDMMEKVNVFIPFPYAQKFFDMKDKATEIIIRIDRDENVPQVKKNIKAILESKFPNLVLLDWKEEDPGLIAAANLKYANFTVIICILLFLAVFIITNTLTMTVFERIPEIGTLRAMGMESNQIWQMFLIEGVVLGFLGTILGWIISAPFVYYLNFHGLAMDPNLVSAYNLPMDNVLKSANTIGDWALTLVVCLFAGVIGAYFPSRRASRVKIVDALKKGVK
jgi:putative ABC transport system permease protein